MKREQILQIFAAHARWYKKEPNGKRADFTGVDLSHSDFSATNFNGAIFVRAKLVGSIMSCANFYSCDFTGADLQRAYLSCADCHDVNFTDAILDCANLANADLSGANLSGASFVNAYLYTADLRCARLNWNSNDLIAELLRRAAETDLLKQQLAGLVLICRDRPWDKLIRWFNFDTSWAIDELALWVKEGDNVPEILKQRR